MSDEIIKLIEYATGNEIVKGMFWVYIVFGTIAFILTLAIIIYTFKSIIKANKEFDDKFRR